jgi:AhpD family alkylhydroperoxidase
LAQLQRTVDAMSTTTESQPRLDIGRDAPDLYRAMVALDRASHSAGIEPLLHELVKIRASQINGCAYCIDMHTRDARKLGESERRLYALAAWRESPLFSERERAAFAFAEAVTHISEAGVPDDVYAAAAEQFDRGELAALLYAVVAINCWNRLAITAHSVFQPLERAGDLEDALNVLGAGQQRQLELAGAPRGVELEDQPQRSRVGEGDAPEVDRQVIEPPRAQRSDDPREPGSGRKVEVADRRHAYVTALGEDLAGIGARLRERGPVGCAHLLSWSGKVRASPARHAPWRVPCGVSWREPAAGARSARRRAGGCRPLRGRG